MPLPPKLQEIVTDFAGMERDEKIETLIAYARILPRFQTAFRRIDPNWNLSRNA